MSFFTPEDKVWFRQDFGTEVRRQAGLQGVNKTVLLKGGMEAPNPFLAVSISCRTYDTSHRTASHRMRILLRKRLR
jgi:hypothetical protein